MRRVTRLALGALLAGLALSVAGCGGSDSSATGAEGAASIAPASATVYATINTDLDSGQVDQLEELLAKFPDRERLFAEIQKSLAEDDLSWEQDIKPALGDTLDVVLLDFDSDDFVGILKPGDEAKFKSLLATSDDPTVSREIEGWTVFADSEAVLDRFESARSSGSLEDDEQFEDAMGDLPEEALVKLYVDGEAATKAAESADAGGSGKNRLKAFAAALGAESSGISFEGALTSELEDAFANIEPYESKLVEAAPEDALAFISGNGFGKVDESLDEAGNSLDELREMLGVDVERILHVLDGEFALWVGPGTPIPEVTFLAETKNTAEAMAALDQLAGLVPPEAGAERRTTTIDGVEAKQLVLDGFPITYATFDGRVIVTTRPGAISDVREGGDSLADDAEFKQATEDAGMGDSTFGFVYLDLEQLGALIEGFSGLSGGDIPPEVARNLEPLGAFVFSAGGKPEDLKLSAFLAIE